MGKKPLVVFVRHRCHQIVFVALIVMILVNTFWNFHRGEALPRTRQANPNFVGGRLGRHVNGDGAGDSRRVTLAEDSSRVRKRARVRLKFVFRTPDAAVTNEDVSSRDKNDANAGSRNVEFWANVTELPVFGSCEAEIGRESHETIRKGKLMKCSCKPNTLVDYQAASFTGNTRVNVTQGGQWSPTACHAAHAVALIVPWQNTSNMDLFLRHMHPFLQRQQLSYRLFLVKQKTSTELVNHGKLRNIGFLEAKRIQPFDCFVFQDSSIVPLNDYNMYACAPQPLILATSIDGWSTGVSFDGAAMFTSGHFQMINGYSDPKDEKSTDFHIYNKIVQQNLSVVRYPAKYGAYRYVGPRDGETEEGLSESERLTSPSERNRGLRQTSYRLTAIVERHLCTVIEVDLKEPQR